MFCARLLGLGLESSSDIRLTSESFLADFFFCLRAGGVWVEGDSSCRAFLLPRLAGLFDVALEGSSLYLEDDPLFDMTVSEAVTVDFRRDARFGGGSTGESSVVVVVFCLLDLRGGLLGRGGGSSSSCVGLDSG